MSVVTAADVEHAGAVLVVAAGDVITPLARDRAKELGVRLERSSNSSTSSHPSKTSHSLHPKAARNGTAGQPPVPRSDLPGLPPATVSGLLRANALPRSGVLYRRGGYGLDGHRDERQDGPARSLGRPAVAVVGAGHVGAAAGIRLAETDLFERLTLIDVVDGLAAGLALDMWHSAGMRGFTTRVTGSTDIGALAGADIVVITAGRPRKPGMTRTDLTAANAEIIRGIADTIRDRAPHAIVIVVTNPLEEMTYLTNRITGFPAERVIGMGGVLDTARFCSLVALTGVAKPNDIHAIVLGSHGAEMVIPLSQATIAGKPLEDLLDAATLADIVQRTRESGAEVTRLLKAGSAYVSPGSAIARQVEAVVRGSDAIVPACVVAHGAYGIRSARIGLPVRLGPQGVREIVELELRRDELRDLQAAAAAIDARTQALS